jgi:hypothetical protein
MNQEEINQRLALMKQFVELNAELQAMHRDALLQRNFSREEAIQIICSGNKPINTGPRQQNNTSDEE